MANKDFQTLVPHIRELIPGFIRENESFMVDFVDAYFEWLEQDGNVQNLLYNLEDAQNIEKSLNNFYEYFRREYMSQIPADIESDPELTFKQIRDLYRSKGTEASIKLLFRILYDDTIVIKYPGERILKPSDGIWLRRQYLRTTSTAKAIEDFVNRQVYSPDTKSYAIAENVIRRDVGGTVVTEVDISNVQGLFDPGATVKTIDDNPEVSITLTGVVNSYAIINAGTGYSDGTEIPIDTTSGDSGEQAKAIISRVGNNGEILAIEITDPGFNYGAAPTTDLTGFGNGDAQLTFGVGGIFTGKGYFRNTQGFLSDIIVLQDGEKFQEFSYTINSKETTDQYRDILKRTVHPAGVRFSGELTIINDLSSQAGSSLGTQHEATYYEVETFNILQSNVRVVDESILTSIDISEKTTKDGFIYEVETFNDFGSYTQSEYETAYGIEPVYKFYERNLSNTSHITTTTS